MKRICTFLILLIITGSMLTGCTKTSNPIKVYIGTSASYPPFESVDLVNREIVGFDIYLMRAVAKKDNLDVEFSNTEYNELFTGVSNCNIDGEIDALKKKRCYF
jgi:polar amino acid transport system substrate-binding protein